VFRSDFGPALATLAVALALLAGAGEVAVTSVRAQQPKTSIGIDADISGNADTTVGPVDNCAVISEGDSHQVDVFVQDVTDLQAWEAVFTFEPAVLEVTEVDVQRFMAANEGSDVQDVSGELPDGDGRYQLAVFDAADPFAPDSGSGVLARVTVKGVGPGVSALLLPLSDLDDDGAPDEGPLLRDIDVNSIGDANGDTLFDGPIADARIAVDASCTDPLGPTSRSESEGSNDGDGIGAVTIAVIVAGSVAAVAVGGLATAWTVRRRPRPEG